MRSKDQNYKYAREARWLRRALRHVEMMRRVFSRYDLRAPTLPELRVNPRLLAIKVFEDREWLVEKVDYRRL